MSDRNRKTNRISKETQEAIKKFLTSNESQTDFSAGSPTIELDANFSKILQKKREEQLEASRQKLYESNLSKLTESTIEANETFKSSPAKIKLPATPKRPERLDLENSMLVVDKNNSMSGSGDEDSFLALERQCNLEDKREQMLNANDTLLFDVEPPAELWNQTLNQSYATTQLLDLDTTQQNEGGSDSDSDETIEISPIKYVGFIRPSTIIEETSSQMNSANTSNQSFTSTKTLSMNNSGAADKTNKTNETIESFKSAESSNNDSDASMLKEGILAENKYRRQARRDTFAFAVKRRNLTFSPNAALNANECESLANISEDMENEIPEEETVEGDLINLDTDDSDVVDKTGDSDRFNNTLEAMDFFLEEGRKIIEQTPVAKRDRFQRTFIETPLLSCKRKRVLDELASIEMMPSAKRGPLIDFSTPEIINQPRTSKFNDK